MATIRYRVPYQIDVLAHDSVTGKRVGNTWYVKSNLYTGSPPAYGAPVAGSSTTTLLASFDTLWESCFLAVLSAHYVLDLFTMRAIIGYGYNQPFRIINAATFGGVTGVIQTSTPHGFNTNNFVRITGVTTPAGVNGTYQVTVLSPTVFEILTSAVGLYTGTASVQLVSGQLGWVYADKETLVDVSPGLVAGQALPIFNDVSVQRLNAGVGKSFRSRVGMAIIGEASVLDGKLEPAAITDWATALAAFNVSFSNGGSDATGGLSHHVVCPKKPASLLVSPFTDSETFALQVDSFHAHSRLGSQINRKPKLAGT